MMPQPQHAQDCKLFLFFSSQKFHGVIFGMIKRINLFFVLYLLFAEQQRLSQHKMGMTQPWEVGDIWRKNVG